MSTAFENQGRAHERHDRSPATPAPRADTPQEQLSAGRRLRYQ